MSDLDVVDYAVLDRFWSTEVWFSRVGTDTERNDWRARAPDPGPRGDVTTAGVQTKLTECAGEVEAR